MFWCDNCANITVSCAILSLCIAYGFFKRSFAYWKRRNVFTTPPSIPFGHFTDVVLRRTHFTAKLQELYTAAKAKSFKYLGLYFFTRRILLLMDPDLLKIVLNTEFQHFHDRTLPYDEKNEPLTAHLVALTGNKWKHLRAKLTPTFTSGKLKTMFHTMQECGEEMVKVLEKHGDGAVEIKDVVSRYTTDIIGSCAFGINCNSLRNPDAEFRQMGRRVFKPTGVLTSIKLLILRNIPALWKLLRFKQLDPAVSTFFINAVSETVQYRRDNNFTRNDMLQILMKLMEDNDGKPEEAPLTMNEVAAQSFLMFIAGFETSSSAVTFTLYELSMHEEIQNEVRKEIKEVLGKYDGKVTYEALTEMPELEKVICESLRKYPPFELLMRKCTKSYQFPGTKTVIEEGTSVLIPIHAIHHDPEYFPDPQKFDPQRFTAEAIKERKDTVYLPFGSGPRICIGVRFAMIQVKIALVALLTDFEFTMNEKTKVPVEKDKNAFILSPLGGVWLNVNKIK